MKTKRKFSGKAVALLLAVALVMGGAIGGTIAWLIDETDSVVNTFTYGDINIELTETKGTLNEETQQREGFKILPGNDIEKDPKVTVKAGSEDCWLFVKIEEADWPSFTETVDGQSVKKVRYEVADGWTQLTVNGSAVAGVYYRTNGVSSSQSDQDFAVLKNDKVTVSENLTKTEVKTASAQKPTLTFTAYAVQKDSNIDTVNKAWSVAKTGTLPDATAPTP